MVTPKTIADLLTAARFGLAWVILWLGITEGAEALPTAVVLLLMAWLTDVLDGPLARRDPTGRHTWIGDRDLETDITVSVGVLAFLTLSGYMTPQVAIAYAAGCAALLWHFRSLHLAWAAQTPPYAGMILVALREARPYGLAMLGYVALVIIVTWPRFPQTTIPQFLNGMHNLDNHRPAAGEPAPVPEQARVKRENGNNGQLQHP